MKKWFLDELGVEHPILQAPMAGGGDTPELVACVSEAGALGCLGAAYSSPEQIIESGAKIRRLTKRPFAVNLFSPLLSQSEVPQVHVQRAANALSRFYKEFSLPTPVIRPSAYTFTSQVEACLTIDAAVLSFTFGTLPEDAIAAFKARGMFLAGTATTVQEALALQKSGVDAIIAQGSEAGGHRGTFIGSFEGGMIGLMALIPQIRDACSLPVIAAGGIMDGRGIAAALCLGADAVQLGTAFLACDESGIPQCYKAALLETREDQLALTSAFSGRVARGIKNLFTEEMRGAERSDAVLPFPLQNQLTRPIRAAAAAKADSRYLSLWAGQGIRMARRLKATRLVDLLLQETSEAAADLASRAARFPVMEQVAPNSDNLALYSNSNDFRTSHLLCERPKEGEYPPYAFMYMRHVDEGISVLAQMVENGRSTCEFLGRLSPKILRYRYEPGKWTIKDIICHVTDDERIYAYRALRFSRADGTVLPGFDEKSFAAVAAADTRRMTDLLEEFQAVRNATVALFRSLDDKALLREGVADGKHTTVRALAYHIAGHELHHMDLIRRLYLTGSVNPEAS